MRLKKTNRTVPSRPLHRLVRRFRRLTTLDKIQKGDQVLCDGKWIDAGGLSGTLWDRQVYKDSPPLRRLLSPNKQIRES